VNKKTDLNIKNNNVSKFSIGIVGGRGIMGKFFESVFLRYGIQTSVWSRKSEETLEEFCKKLDIIMVSVSIDVTEKIIEEIGKCITKNQCICDVTSVKVAPMNAMKKTEKPYFGMHPMFAPPLSGNMEGQNVIFCSGEKSSNQEKFIKDIFERDNAHILESTATEHDEIMSIVQGLSHFFDVTFVQTLHARGIDLEKIFASRSPAYALKLMLSGRTLYQDSELYGNIQIQNPQNIETLNTFFKEAQKLFTTIKNKDLNAFNEIFHAQTKFLGKYAKKSQDESDVIIDYLANRILSKDKNLNKNMNCIEVKKIKNNKNIIGILGPKNTFSYLAAYQFFTSEKFENIRLYPTISSIFSAYKKGEISEIFVPVENFLHGSVAESLDGICAGDLPIQAVYEMKISPALFVGEATERDDIKEIFSHSQALAQCSNFIENTYPNALITPTSSTAEAMSFMRKTNSSAAIAPQEQLELKNVKILYSDLANTNENATRFAYIANATTQNMKADIKKEKQENILLEEGALVFYLEKDAPGSLEKVIHLFAENNINLTKIESRPTGKGFGEYLFFITYENEIKNLNSFLDKLKKITSEYKLLGEYNIYK